MYWHNGLVIVEVCRLILYDNRRRGLADNALLSAVRRALLLAFSFFGSACQEALAAKPKESFKSYVLVGVESNFSNFISS